MSDPERRWRPRDFDLVEMAFQAWMRGAVDRR